MSKMRKRFLIVGILLLVAGSALYLWVNQSPVVEETDLEKAEEVANDDDLLDAIDAGMNQETETVIETDTTVTNTLE